MKSIKEFIGNYKQLSLLADWLTSWYHEPTKEIKGYAIIFASSGNGKTTIPQLLANDFKVELFEISPYDIESGNQLNNFIKSLNLATLKGKKHKIILIDDINEFASQYKKKLYEIPAISRNPIIYTSSTYKLPSDFRRKALSIRIKKPLTSELLPYLRSLNSKLPNDVLETIARESKSVRSAVNSLYNASVNDLTHDIQTRGGLLRLFKNRDLSDNLTNWDIKFIFDCIRSYDTAGFKVKMRLADMDYRICRYWKEIGFREVDPFMINNMIEPIEKVKLEYQFKRNYVKKEPKKEVIKVEKKAEIKASVGKWL